MPKTPQNKGLSGTRHISLVVVSMCYNGFFVKNKAAFSAIIKKVAVPRVKVAEPLKNICIWGECQDNL